MKRSHLRDQKLAISDHSSDYSSAKPLVSNDGLKFRAIPGFLHPYEKKTSTPHSLKPYILIHTISTHFDRSVQALNYPANHWLSNFMMTAHFSRCLLTIFVYGLRWPKTARKQTNRHPPTRVEKNTVHTKFSFRITALNFFTNAKILT